MNVGRASAVICITATMLIPIGVPAAPPTARATLNEVMLKIVDPASNGVFYIGRQAPKSDDEWKALQSQTLILSEIATSLMTPARALDTKQWIQDAKRLLDASNAAYAAANEKNVAAVEALNDQLRAACKTCHEHYFPKR
jgi:hypothetical protein